MVPRSRGSRRSALPSCQAALQTAAAPRHAIDATMPLRSPKPSIREMKAAIVRAGLETEDLVERSHVEERYEEALALQPREVDQSSSKAKGMAQAAALKNKPKAEPKARPPSQNESGWWRMEDLSISASHCVETPSRHRCDSFPGMMEVGGFFSDFEAVRTASRHRDAPRRCPRSAAILLNPLCGRRSPPWSGAPPVTGISMPLC